MEYRNGRKPDAQPDCGQPERPNFHNEDRPRKPIDGKVIMAKAGTGWQAGEKAFSAVQHARKESCGYTPETGSAGKLER